MQRQKSIHWFLKKDQSSGDNTVNGRNFQSKNAVAPICSTVDLKEEIVGTETPPEKVPRQIFPLNNGYDENNSSVFSFIKHKFIKVDSREKPHVDRDLVKDDPFKISSVCIKIEGSEGLLNASVALQSGTNRNSFSSNGNSNQKGRGLVSLMPSGNHGFGPETPIMQPFVPGLKRAQDNTCSSGDRSYCFSLNASKRIKSLEGLNFERKNLEEEFETTSKFEWLHLSQIKDANGRRPGDPLYDRHTLYIPPDALRKMSASQKQYWDVKCKYMDVVLFFKVGKFYELYELDAEIGRKELDWKMTLSGVGKCRQVGISENGIDEAVQKLLVRGYKVGRMEQLETSEQAKSRGSTSVIRRKLVHVLTPSTTSEGNIGPDAVHLLAVKETCNELEDGSTIIGFAFVDCAALKVWVGTIDDDASCAALGALLMQVSPKEVIYNARVLSKDAQKALKRYSSTGPAAPLLSPVQTGADFIDPAEVKNFLDSKGYFKGFCNKWDHTFDGANHDVALCALGSLVNHLERLMLDEVLCNGDVLSYEVYKGSLKMDGQTLVNLEIFNNNADGSQSGTLYKYLDNCLSSPGKRLLRKWICQPLKDVEKINHRLDVVDRLVENSDAILSTAQYLRKVPDLDRLLGRVKASIQSSEALLLPLVGAKILKQRVKAFGLLVKGLRIGLDLLRLLQKECLTSSLAKVVSLPVLDGDNGLDKFLTQFEAALDSDFPNFQRNPLRVSNQTLVGIQDHNATEFDAETLSILMELFIEKATEWSQVIYAISCVDVLRSFSITAKFSSGVMCRPVMLPLSKPTNFCKETGGPTLNIKGLWHPYALGESGGLPVSNDLHLGGNTNIRYSRTLLLTGPNMGGKSTLLRATCLAVIMAQLGCYVPGETCVLSLVDIIFTRLGATDRIMTGESTFFIECTETASVLQNATHNSLVLLDELGRGTSTFDGYAIAYAVFRHLVEMVNCRLLFATHYHPLTKEFGSHPHVTLQHMACSFKLKSQSSSTTEQELVFLYRLVSGTCPESYGMQVALMAGIPRTVVESALSAGQVMKKMNGESFRSCEGRANFSTLHEEWFKTLLEISKTNGGFNKDNDLFDTLFCLWRELNADRSTFWRC